MSRSQLTKVDILSRVLKIKKQLQEEENYNQHKKDTYDVVHRYLNQVLDVIDEYRY